tara:strand:+ start:417 stop:1007 length:591 start_codon:yes stop_codon:yes gene_type:complete
LYKLGITGGIGSGKSIVCNYLSNKGASVFDSDKESKELLLHNNSLQKKIINTFGSHVTYNNELDFSKLASYVFQKKSLQKKLNSIIWPKVFELIKIAAIKEKKNQTKLFIVEAALLIEANYNDYFDSILLITASEPTRIKRVLKRNNIPEEQIQQRIKLQMSDEEKKLYAQNIIDNNGSFENLYQKINIFYEGLNF